MDKRGEKLRENMYDAMDQYGRGSKEVVQASRILDEYMNEHCSYRNN